MDYSSYKKEVLELKPDFSEVPHDGSYEAFRRRLPHWEADGRLYFVTFCLQGAIPKHVLAEIRAKRELWLKTNHKPWSRDQTITYRNHFQKPIEDGLDRSEGICLLKELPYRTIIETSLRFFDQDRYRLDAFVIMPSHVHVLVLPLSGSSLSKILHSWKSYSSLQINRLRDAEGKRVWQEERFDSIVRSIHHLNWYRRYIQENPIKAGLSKDEYTLGKGSGI